MGVVYRLPDEAEDAMKSFADALVAARGGTCSEEYWGMGYTFVIQPGDGDETRD